MKKPSVLCVFPVQGVFGGMSIRNMCMDCGHNPGVANSEEVMAVFALPAIAKLPAAAKLPATVKEGHGLPTVPRHLAPNYLIIRLQYGKFIRLCVVFCV